MRPPDPLAKDPVWLLWRDLTARFPLWRSALWWLLPSPARVRENSYFWFDLIVGLRSMGSSQAVVARLATVSDVVLAAVVRLAEINGKRQEHFFRSVVLAYITVPLTVGAIWVSLSPTSVKAAMTNADLLPFVGGTIGGLATAIVVRFMADWRAQAFLSLLQMVQAERACLSGTTLPELPPPSGRST